MNELATVELSAEKRAMLRDAIKRHPGWADYRFQHDTDMAQMATKEQIVACCNELEINISDVISGIYDAPKPAEKPAAPKQRNAVETMKLAAEGGLFTKPAPAPARGAAAQADMSPEEMIAQAMQAIAGRSKAPVDLEQVRAELDERLNQKADLITDRMFALVAEMQDRLPTTRIELKRGEDVKTIEGNHHPEFKTLLQMLSARQTDGYPVNVWIVGPSGSGKTHAAKMVAKAFDLPFHFNGSVSGAHEIMGWRDGGGTYHRTAFREAFEFGGVYLWDEVDSSDNSALLAMNAALGNGICQFPDAQIERHKDCYIIATANTTGLGATADYVGRAKIDGAFLNRFPGELFWDYDEKLEQSICGNASFAQRVQRARAKARAAGIKLLITPRHSAAAAAFIAGGMSEDKAALHTYLAKLTPDQRKIVEG